MTMHKSVWGGLVVLSLTLSCSGTNFSANSRTMAPTATPPTVAPVTTVGAPAGANAAAAPAASPAANTNSNNNKDATANLGTASSLGTGTSPTACLGSAAKLYNIVLVLDSSGSQKDTDPTNLRISGSKYFLQQLATFADANPTVTLNVSEMAFAATATVGAHAWQTLNSQTLPNLNSDIDGNTATLSNGTYYLGALQAADTLLTTIKATASPDQRNFILFLTDGQPNGAETTPQILSEVATLTQTHGVAMITLGTGTQVTQPGVAILTSMALPNPGIVAPDHVGKFYRVATQTEMTTIGDILTQAVSGCGGTAAGGGIAVATGTGTGSGSVAAGNGSGSVAAGHGSGT